MCAATALAGEKTVLHCFAFTPVETATQADWSAFYKASDALPGKIPGLKRVWYGKLNRPLSQNLLKFADAETGKKMRAEKKGTTEFSMVERKNGACMEFDNLKAFQAYGTHEAHTAWEAAYKKVRVDGTTTYQIVPE
jgi:hypothetical protein